MSNPNPPRNPPVFFVVGPAGHGKTTVREILARLVRLRGGSCSDVIFHFLALRRGVPIEELRAIPKEDLRPDLIKAGDFLCGTGELTEVAPNAKLDQEVYRHPSALIRTLYMNGYNVIDGVRRRLELTHAKDHLDWNGIEQCTILVTSPNGPEIPDNTEDLSDLADERIVNDGTPVELEAKIAAMLARRYPQEPVKPHPTETAA